jgi:alpha-D-ribose 1-methylphosphonate 5-triphosphate synthase subunit PhnG
MIYTTFKQWVKGRFLETGEPRKKAYSKDELALIEMGWGYGYDAGVEAEREACAAICDALHEARVGKDNYFAFAANAIRELRAKQ